MTGGRDAPAGNRRMVRPLRLTAFGARRAASRRQPRAPACASSPPPRSREARRRAEGAILPGATILKPGKITGEGAARHA